MHKKIKNKWIKFGYKHTLLAIIVTILTVLVIDTAAIAAILEWFQDLKYFGGFIGGFLLVMSLTAAPAAVLLLSVANNVDPLPLVLIAAAGSVIGDWLILKFIEDKIGHELRPLARKLDLHRRIKKLRKSRLRYLVTGFGAFMVMLPTPDELGLTLMGIGHLKRYKILIICYVLDAIGIYSLIYFGRNLI